MQLENLYNTFGGNEHNTTWHKMIGPCSKALSKIFVRQEKEMYIEMQESPWDVIQKQ